MKVLSDDYQGKIRFGYIDVLKDEQSKETFEIYAVPQNFYCRPEDGKILCHEMHAMSLGYKPVREFLEGGWKNPENVYQTFEMPVRVGQYGLYWKYFIKDFTKDWYNHYLNEAQELAKEHGHWEKLHPSVTEYFNTYPITAQAKNALGVLIILILIVWWISLTFICCILRNCLGITFFDNYCCGTWYSCFCCCSRKAAPEKQKKE